MTRTRYRLRLFRCWLRHVGRSIGYYRRLLRWWRRGAYGHKPLDARFAVYSAERCLVEMEAWLEKTND